MSRLTKVRRKGKRTYAQDTRNAPWSCWTGLSEDELSFLWKAGVILDATYEKCLCVQLFETPVCHAFTGTLSGPGDIQSDVRQILECDVRGRLEWIPESDVSDAVRKSFRKALSRMSARRSGESVQRLRRTLYDLTCVQSHNTGRDLLQWESAGAAADEQDDWSPHEIVQRLKQATIEHEERRRLIIDAEVLSFRSGELRDLLPLLREFIVRFRHSEDLEDMVAVGSAVRKYVMNMADEDLRIFPALFDPSPTAPIAKAIELELAKAVVWRWTAQPPEVDDAEPSLASRLFDLVATYLRTRLISQKNIAAIALNAILGLLLLRSRHIPSLFELLRSLDAPWFTELVARRAEWLRVEIEERFPREESRVFVKSLAETEEHLKRPAA